MIEHNTRPLAASAAHRALCARHNAPSLSFPFATAPLCPLTGLTNTAHCVLCETKGRASDAECGPYTIYTSPTHAHVLAAPRGCSRHAHASAVASKHRRPLTTDVTVALPIRFSVRVLSTSPLSAGILWRSGPMGKAFGLAISRSRVQILLEATLRNNLGLVVHTYVPLSPSSITWYWPKGGDALWLGR